MDDDINVNHILHISFLEQCSAHSQRSLDVSWHFQSFSSLGPRPTVASDIIKPLNEDGAKPIKRQPWLPRNNTSYP